MHSHELKYKFKNWTNYLVEYVHNVFFKLILFFIVNFFGLGLYQLGFFKTNFILAAIFIIIDLYLAKQLLYKRARPTKILVLLVTLLIAFYIASSFAPPVFENIGLTSFLSGTLDFSKFQKPVYDCRTNDCDMNKVSESYALCKDAIILRSQTGMESRETLSLSSDGLTCRVSYEITKSSISAFQGKYMNCDFPKTVLTQTASNYMSNYDSLKYCDGPLKDYAANPFKAMAEAFS